MAKVWNYFCPVTEEQNKIKNRETLLHGNCWTKEVMPFAER